MFTLFIFIFLLHLNVYSDTHDIEVVNSGIVGLKKNDMVVVFFLEVKHHGDKARRAMVNVIECCERITEEDTDCDLIDLYGGDFGVINPGTVKNFTLVYPNLYGYNRRGFCLVNILHRCLGSSDSSELHHRIDFDTLISTEYVPQVLQGWYNPDTLIVCETPDLDPFDHCNPVDCHIKYSGYRNYYNRKWKMCQRVPLCISNPDKELPDVAYIPNSNACRNLENTITKEDIDQMTKGKLEKKASEPKMVDIRCHHGEIDPKTGLCICDYGWKSEVFDQDSYNSGNSIYSMCTIRCNRDNEYKYLPLLVGVLLALWVFTCVVCCEKHDCFRKGRALGGSFPPQAAVYFPLRGSNEGGCSHAHSLNVSSQETFDGCTRQNFVSHFSMPTYQLSEKTFKSFRTSKSKLSFASEKNT